MSTEMSKRDYRSEVESLTEHVKAMCSYCRSVCVGLAFREDDDFGLMVLNFLAKQIDHAESILLLIPRRDAGLIARTMIEGLYQILWSYHESDDRGRRWRSFSVVHNWRLIQSKKAAGKQVDPAREENVSKLLALFGNLHRRKKAKAGDADPFHKSWRGEVQLAHMADAVGRDLYDNVYSDLSDWEHWGLSSIGDAMMFTGNAVAFETGSYRVAAQSLAGAFQCLIQTTQVLDAYFSLERSHELEALLKAFTVQFQAKEAP